MKNDRNDDAPTDGREEYNPRAGLDESGSLGNRMVERPYCGVINEDGSMGHGDTSGMTGEYFLG